MSSRLAHPARDAMRDANSRQSKASSTVCNAGSPGRSSARSSMPASRRAASAYTQCGMVVGLKEKSGSTPPLVSTSALRPAAIACR
eukprot:scaffold7310_cov116-Isochrysis_galbana.AAC.6